MSYKEIFKERNQAVSERFALASARIREIAAEEHNPSMDDALTAYFQKTAKFLVLCIDRYKDVALSNMEDLSLQVLQKENYEFYSDILPQNYEHSYANPAYAVDQLGEEFGRILSFLYCELRSERAYVVEQNLRKMTLLDELFLGVHFLFEQGQPTYHRVREHIYSFFYDNAREWAGYRVREMLDPELDFARCIIMDHDLNDLRYLYYYGEYITENEIKTAEFLNSLPQEKIDAIARTFTEGYRRGLEIKRVDITTKKIVDIRYNIGFERVIRAAILQFEEMGLATVTYRYALNALNKRQNIRIGYQATNPNEQYGYDHRFDNAVFLDKKMVDRKIECMQEAYETFAENAAGFAGPACFEVFGWEPFAPVNKAEAFHLSDRQKGLLTELSTLSNQLMNNYINQEEKSYTIIAYPIPAIGDNFEELFEEIYKVNTLDNEKYKEIQQTLIETLDQASAVQIMGRGKNMTNLMIQLNDIEDPATQTKFENCLADENIPVGEVFTTPRLKGTNGLLHISSAFLEGLHYKELRLTFEDGVVTDYSCENFADPEEGKRYIEENLFYGRNSLPMGEFAIGTNTTAYMMATRYAIFDKLPILIAEKMGPHIAVGDSCYAYSEDVKVFNPDGREMVARENDFSLKRYENPKQAYFNCHTDIVLPYEVLDRITAISYGEVDELTSSQERFEKPIILEGRFALQGTFELNEVFAQDGEDE